MALGGNSSWDKIQQGVKDTERLIVQREYNASMIKARQTLEFMVKNLADQAGIMDESDLKGMIDVLYENRWISKAAEVVGGINILEQTGNAENLKEELGDLLLQVVMHAQIAKEEGLFTLEDVMRGITDKMIRRHPHVFGTTAVSGSDEVLVNWAEIKKQEKEGKEWMESYLPGAFDEAEELIGAARKRKGFR